MKKFIMSIVLAVSILFLPSTSQAYLPDDVQHFNGHYYKVFNYGMTWDDAKIFCENLGGHLVTITSQQEQNFIEKLLNQGNRNVYWLGGYKNQNSNWTWVTGEAFYYSKWAQGEPNGDGLAIEIYKQKNPYANYNTFGEWNDISSRGNGVRNESFFYTENYGLICEWDYSQSMKVQNR